MIARAPIGPVAGAVVVPCGRSKSIVPASRGNAATLPLSSQDELARVWLEAVQSLPSAVPAGQLYIGRGFHLAKEAAVAAAAPLFVISAGLGLVKAEQLIPSYALTISPGVPDSVVGKVTGQFDHASWWESVSGCRYSSRFVTATEANGPILVALSAPYAELVKDALGVLPDEAVARLRIFGAQLGAILPPKLSAQVMPFDDRLGLLLPGTRTDFSQRALSYFAKNILRDCPKGSTERHATTVSLLMATLSMPVKVKRAVKSDAELLEIIRSARSGGGRPLSIRRLRHEYGVACEQTRFSRLAKAVAGEAGE